MERKLRVITASLDAEEYRQFKLQVQAHGGTESAYIREALALDPRPRGAPKGTVRKRKVGRPRKKAAERGAKAKNPLFEFE